jgi:hypothetical protein
VRFPGGTDAQRFRGGAVSENPTENQRKLAPRAASFADTLAAIAASAPRGFVIAPLSQSVRSLSPNVRQPEWLLSRNLSQRMPLLSRRVD